MTMNKFYTILIIHLILVSPLILHSQDTLLVDYLYNKTDIARIKELIDKGADVNKKNQFGTTPLEYACKTGNLEVAKLLIEHGAKINEKIEHNKTVLIDALVENNDYELVKYLLQQGADVNAKDDEGIPTLFYIYPSGQSVFNTRLNLIKLLEKYHADINQTDRNGMNLLFRTASSCDLPATQYIIENKHFNTASIDSLFKKNIFDFAHCDLDIVKYLLSRKPKNPDYSKLYFGAALSDNVKVVSYILDTLKKADVNERDKFRRTALMLTYSHISDELTNYLIEKGIDLNARDSFGVSVFMQASYIFNL